MNTESLASLGRRLTGRLNWSILGRVLLLAAVVTVFAIGRGYFFPSEQLPSLAIQAQVFGLVALGLTAPMIAGELDLSVGSMAAVASIVAIQLQSLGMVPSILIAAGIAMALGAAQGTVIARLNISSLVFTIATLIGLRGVAYLLSSIGQVSEGPVMLPIEKSVAAVQTFAHPYLYLRPTAILTVVAFVLVGLLLAFTRYGREIYAIGGGRAEARAAGVPLTRPMIVAFALSGLCAGLAGALSAYDGGSADPKLFESQLLLGLTAVLVGGVSVYGGRGNVAGVSVGVLILAAMRSGMQDLALPNYATDLATGVLLSGFLVYELTATRLARRRLAGARRRPAKDASRSTLSTT